MKTTIHCPFCGQAYELDDFVDGAEVECGKCNQEFTLSLSVIDAESPMDTSHKDAEMTQENISRNRTNKLLWGFIGSFVLVLALLSGIMLSRNSLSSGGASSPAKSQPPVSKSESATPKNEPNSNPFPEWSAIKSVDKVAFDVPLPSSMTPVYSNPFGFFDVYVLPASQYQCRFYVKVDPKTRLILRAYLFFPIWVRDGVYSSEECKKVARWIESTYGVDAESKIDGHWYLFKDANPKSYRSIYCTRKNFRDTGEGDEIIIDYRIRYLKDNHQQEGKDITDVYGITLGDPTKNSSLSINWGKDGVPKKPAFIADSKVKVLKGVVSDISIVSTTFTDDREYMLKMLFAVRKSLEQKYEMTMDFDGESMFTYKKNGRSVTIAVMLDKYGDLLNFEVRYRFDQVYDQAAAEKKNAELRQQQLKNQREKNNIDEATRFFGN